MLNKVEKYLYVVSPVLILVSLVYFYLTRKFGTVSIVTLIAGLGIGLLFFLRYYDEIVQKITRRKLKYGINSFVITLIVLGLVVIVYLVAISHNKRVDLTQAKRFSLSEQTIKILQELKGPIHAYAFFSKSQDRSVITELFKEYSYHYKDFDFQIVDPDLNPGLVKEMGVEEYGDVIIEYSDKREKVKENTEEGITNTLIKLSQIQVKSIYFVTGHGERSLKDYSNEGYDQINAAIKAENLETKEILLLQEEKVPEDCVVLVVAGPQLDYQPHEVKLIEDYIRGGGSVFFMMDPRIDGSGYPNINELLAKFGLELGNDVIIDPLSRVFSGDFFMPVINTYTYNPITRDFRIATFLKLAQSIRVEDNPGENISTREVARTSEASWAEKDFSSLQSGKGAKYQEGRDLKGPITVVAYSRITIPGENKVSEDNTNINKEGSENEDKEGYIMVIGDSDFVTNAMYQTQGNKDLFLNSLNFLADRGELITIRPKQQESVYLTLTARQGRIAFLILMIAIPLSVIIAGIYINIRRRVSS